MQISEIFYYPLKSGPAIKTETHTMLQGGFEGDRMFMLVDAETGNFISLRDKFSAPLTQLVAQSAMKLTHNGQVINIDFSRTRELIQTTYRGETMMTYDLGDELSQTFSDLLQHKVRLVHAITGKGYSVDGYDTRNNGFSDGYPILIANQASLDFLKDHFQTDEDITMRRFRPNIVIEGAEPFEEDSWKTIEINGVQYELAKPCQRCVVTTKDPSTGEPHPKSEPIRTLNKLRRGFAMEADGRKSPKVFFGMNAVPKDLPVNTREPVAIAMGVKVIERYVPVHPLVVETKIGAGRLVI